MKVELGWDVLPEKKEHYSLGKTIPRLSPPEKGLVAGVLETFFDQPIFPSPQKRISHEFLQKKLNGCLDEYCLSHYLRLTPNQEKDIQSILRMEALEAGPLTPLLADSSLEEVSIVGIGKNRPVRVYQVRKGWRETPLFFTSIAATIARLNRLGQESGRRLSSHSPTLNTMIPGGSRLHASIDPVCLHGVEASIRKFVLPARKPEDLVDTRILTPQALSFLVHALRVNCNLLVVGNTGSGKTTTLNALLGCLSEDERIILVEETPEITLLHSHLVRLVSNPENGIPMSKLIRETLRMRPDRMVIGEIRFPEEAHAFMEAVLAGQGKGTYATFHGHSSQEAVARLLQFGLLPMDVAWINVMVVQRRWNAPNSKIKDQEIRGITEIVEFSYDHQKKELELIPIFGFDYPKQRLAPLNQSRVVKEQFSNSFPTKNFEKSVERLAQKMG